MKTWASEAKCSDYEFRWRAWGWATSEWRFQFEKNNLLKDLRKCFPV